MSVMVEFILLFLMIMFVDDPVGRPTIGKTNVLNYQTIYKLKKLVSNEGFKGCTILKISLALFLICIMYLLISCASFSFSNVFVFSLAPVLPNNHHQALDITSVFDSVLLNFILNFVD